MMLLHCAVLLLYLNVARTSEVNSGLSDNFVSDVDARYSLWPSIHDGVRLMRIRKREAVISSTTLKPEAKPQVESTQAVTKLSQDKSENGAKTGAQTVTQTAAQPGSQSVQSPDKLHAESPPGPPQQPVTTVPTKTLVTQDVKSDNKESEKPSVIDNKTVNKSQNATTNGTSSAVDDKTKAQNATVTEAPKINLSDPGVVKRAFIVFGGFALLATAYYFFIYRKKGSTNDTKNTHSSIDPNQFRYGVLQSEDKSSNMELSRVPLTMESDEDDDEDLEIFDLGQKKKSLSYINLEQHDEDIVLNDSRSIDMENLLVDIEDKNTDTLINWSSSGSKSIL